MRMLTRAVVVLVLWVGLFGSNPARAISFVEASADAQFAGTETQRDPVFAQASLRWAHSGATGEAAAGWVHSSTAAGIDTVFIINRAQAGASATFNDDVTFSSPGLTGMSGLAILRISVTGASNLSRRNPNYVRESYFGEGTAPYVVCNGAGGSNLRYFSNGEDDFAIPFRFGVPVHLTLGSFSNSVVDRPPQGWAEGKWTWTTARFAGLAAISYYDAQGNLVPLGSAAVGGLLAPVGEEPLTILSDFGFDYFSAASPPDFPLLEIPIPEPGAASLLVAALGALVWRRRTHSS